jgi:hypothetical protein
MDHDQLPTLFDEPEPVLPVLPYGRTSGWSGSTTSRDRARTADQTGITENRQSITLGLLRRAGIDGLTWRELSEQTGWHHGTASGALSVLHKDGQIARLVEKREKCQIYVTPDLVLGRQKAEYQPNVSARLLREVLTEIEQDLLADRRWDAIRRIRATLEVYDA